WALRSSDDRDTVLFASPDGVHALRFSDDHEVVLKTPEPSNDHKVSGDGKRFAVRAARAVYEFDADGTLLRTIELSTSARRFTIEGDDLWVGGRDGTVRHWRGERLVGTFPAHIGSVDTIYRIGRILTTTGSDGGFAAWDPSSSWIEIGNALCPHYD